MASPSTRRLPVVGRVPLVVVVATCGAVAVAVVWVTHRRAPSAWIPQNVLSVALLLFLQRTVHLPNIKVATILLSMAFFYDIFWVFLSGYFFSSSVMITVATGGATREPMPMLLRIPRVGDALGGYSLLGLGDIALPGPGPALTHKRTRTPHTQRTHTERDAHPHALATLQVSWSLTS